MTTNFLQLSEKLAHATTLREKKAISRSLGKLLDSDKDFSETLVRPLILSTIQAMPSMDLVLGTEFLMIRQDAYTDTDGLTKIALGVAFLQDHTAYNQDLDQILLKEIYSILKSQNLELLVNDLTVNLIQVCDGNFNSFL